MFESLCGNCDHKNCCTDSAVPLVFPKELELIKKNTHPHTDYLKIIKINDKSVYAIKKKANSTECIFWDSSTGGCDIYESRPLDCRLYPFDIHRVNGSYHWIVYSCNKNSDWSWTDVQLNSLEHSIGFDDLMMNIDSFAGHTSMILPDESQKTPYTVLRKVNWKNSRNQFLI